MSQSEQKLQIAEQKTVLFYDDEITAVRLDDGRVFVPIRPICDLLGVSWDGQRQRINRDPVLSDVAMSAVITHADIDSSSRRPRTSEMTCLPLDFISGFLFGINAGRVKDEVRDRLIRYQRECYAVLAEAFQDGRLTTDPEIDIEVLQQQDSPAAQAYQMAMAVVRLARQQLIIEAQMAQHGRTLDEHRTRLDQLEAAVGGEHVTEAQASQISQAVKAVALAIGKTTKRNEFGAVYGELYRRFGITSYKMLPAKKFDAAMNFLTEWHQTVAGDTPF